MKIVPHTDDGWKNDHPTGLIAFQHLLKGDPARNDNFMFILARQYGEFLMPRHRHNFDQLRLPVVGDMTLGDGFKLEEGQVGYFSEGMPYGPQKDAPGYRLQLVLQFGGASGYGFMSIEQRREAWAELARTGKFIGPHYHYPDGRVEWALNTIWRQVFGTPLKYPRPRYAKPVIVDPHAFNWLAVPGARGVDHKALGAFSERGVWIEMIRMRQGATWSSRDALARRLFTVLSGSGTASDEAIGRLTALQVDPGETLEIAAGEEMELFLIGLPPIQAPATESDQFDLEEMPAEVQAA